MISFASVTKVFSYSDEVKGAYNLYNQSCKKDTIYKDWKLKEEFQAEGFDGKMHKVCQILRIVIVDEKLSLLMWYRINSNLKIFLYYFTVQRYFCLLLIWLNN